MMALFIGFGLLAIHYFVTTVRGAVAGLERLPDLAARYTTVGIECYGYNGLAYTNNSLCPNSNTCCGVEATCLSNRLCHNPSDSAGTFVRGPCAIQGWDSECAQLCLYNETEYRNVLPRVTICSDGSFCCNNNSQCCQDGGGTFLDANGSIISSAETTVATTSYPPVSSAGTARYTATPSSSAATTTSTTSTAPTTTSTPSSTLTGSASAAASSSSAATSNSGDSKNIGLSLGVGLGAGLPVAAIAVGLAVFAVLRSRRRDEQASDISQSQPLQNIAEAKMAAHTPNMASYDQQPLAELGHEPVHVIYELYGENTSYNNHQRGL
ncbi:hypothetical protein CMQ_1931 [Grosmannia clavigera kw1407]|uniref:Mid2 domain-containing protein n=1 Tax=Grosmannia clavigera (strain kw1407 / UAMH 11150) TaxID=655863 RepID=F0XMW6_GROCL|nr:uncharacterized protein CMQ_1931 [Grosmannia clavigera kw1407]EFX00850.1 hypothetical protein CMQ_1931 [Grosmannia clavigera kw1407]